MGWICRVLSSRVEFLHILAPRMSTKVCGDFSTEPDLRLMPKLSGGRSVMSVDHRLLRLLTVFCFWAGVRPGSRFEVFSSLLSRTNLYKPTSVRAERIGLYHIRWRRWQRCVGAKGHTTNSTLYSRFLLVDADEDLMFSLHFIV